MNIRSLLLCLIACLLTACGESGHSEFQGYVEGENTYLASPYSGLLKKLLVHRGERVKTGQTLFQLDAQPQALIVAQREADLVQAKKSLMDLQQPRRLPEIEAIAAQIAQTDAAIELAALRVKRRKELYARNAIDKDSVDEAVAGYEEKQQQKAQYQANLALARLGSREEEIKAQEAKVQGLTEALNQAKWELDQKYILSPGNGIIFDTYYDEDEFVASQQAVLSLLMIKNIRIEFFVPVETLAVLHLGKKVQFQCYGCKESSTAVVNYISPEAVYVPPLVYSRENNEKIVFRVKAQIEHPQGFKPGQPVTVSLP